MLNLDPAKLLIIAVVAVILLGPDKLPQVARQVGAAWRSFNEFRHRMETEVRSSIPDLPSSADIARLARSPSALLNHLSTLAPDGADQNGNGAAANGAAGDVAATDGTGHPPTPPAPNPMKSTQRHHRLLQPLPPCQRPPCHPRHPRHPLTPPCGDRPGVGRRGRSQPQLSGPRDRHAMALPFIGERKEKPSPDNMTLNQHLGELRRRLIICVIAFLVATIVAVIAYEPILHFLIRPAVRGQRGRNEPARRDRRRRHTLSAGKNCANLYVTSPLDGLSLRVKIAVFGGLTLASPVILFQIWRFITPGLQAREKKYAIPFVAAAFALFLLGAATAYLTLSHALGFLRAVGGPDLQQIYDPIPVPGPGPGPDGPVRNHLPVPGDTGLLGAGPRRDPGPAPALMALGGDPHHGRLGRLHPEL